ncbi:response regulator transcription factor [Pedobacter frigoris]|uniref:response regulator transcription factor n=1 Tax=Pedobacter frigoris TaxID=2571272 RepID=UPI00292D4D9B|nr:LuxR C-terminal-related transcriptional regulator [Pedobacter frigoris]
MYVFNSEMYVLRFIICLLEFGMCCYQLVYYLSRPEDKRRLWYLLLLVLLIVYNVTGGLFPDPRYSLPLVLQNIIAYGSGFVMAAYFPYYFYKAFNLKSLRFHALYGVVLFLLVPYMVFFWVVYPLSGKLEFATSYGMIVLGVYSLVLLYAMLCAIWVRIKVRNASAYPYSKVEMFWVYAAVSPCACMAAFSYFKVGQRIEVLVTNSGFLIITVLFIAKIVKWERIRDEQLEAKYTIGSGASVFEYNCVFYGLTKREVEIVVMISQGKQYKYIGFELFISLDTVKSHVKNVFKKVGVNDKTELVYKLNQESDKAVV